MVCRTNRDPEDWKPNVPSLEALCPKCCCGHRVSGHCPKHARLAGHCSHWCVMLGDLPPHIVLSLQGSPRDTKCQKQTLFGMGAAVAVLDWSMNLGRFATGSCRRVGKKVRRDEPFAIEVLKEVHRILKKQWTSESRRKKPSRSRRLLRIALAGHWLVVGFCTV